MRTYHANTGGLGYSKSKLRSISEELEAKYIAKEQIIRERKRKQQKEKQDE